MKQRAARDMWWIQMSDIGFDPGKIEFPGFGTPSSLPKHEIQGERLWNLVFQRNPDFGGFLVGLFGVMGSGKTSLMHRMARRIMKENPDEVVFWREPLESPLQARNIGDNFQILCERRYPVKIMKMTDHGVTPADNIKIRMFTGFKELLHMVEPQMINVIYFYHNWRWIDLLNKLKLWRSWQTCFFDEFEDIAPGRCKGKPWLMNERFANRVKEIRKSRISMIYTTQNQMDIDYRVKSKTMMYFYLYGARKDEHSPVFRGAIQGLEVGQGWVDYGHSLFGLINFKPILPREPTYIVLPVRRKKEQ